MRHGGSFQILELSMTHAAWRPDYHICFSYVGLSIIRHAMYNIGQYSPMLGWQSIEAPADAPSPEPMTVRAQAVTARSYFPEHSHDWGQLVYAISGVLAVGITGQSFVISPEQAVWLPRGSRTASAPCWALSFVVFGSPTKSCPRFQRNPRSILLARS
ncbi:AraC family ligand binding domain-containing protein [Novosphingobium panipatense]